MFGINEDQNKDSTQSSDQNSAQPPAEPASSSSSLDGPVLPTSDVSTGSEPSLPLPAPAEPPAPVEAIPEPVSSTSLGSARASLDSSTAPATPTPSLLSSSGDEGLVELKKKALQSLTPLVDKLDQTPEEKFKTTMMLIQASDNADLVPEAYEAANRISDEKAKAQALLDVVNEINYFTKNKDSDSKK